VVVISLAVASLVIAWFYLAVISRTDPWYRNTDMNIHNMADALAINSGQSPYRIDQPATLTKFLLALDYRVRHFTGQLPVWNTKKLGGSPDPLPEIRNLIHIGRLHSRVLVMLFILAAAGLTWSVTRNPEATCLAVILLCGSAGVLFHGLLVRPELLCVFLGNILALHCTYRATASQPGIKSHLWLFLAGLLGGLSVLEKLPGMGFLAACYAWCWLAALLAPSRPPESSAEAGPGRRWEYGLLPAAAGGTVLWVLFMVVKQPGVYDPVAVMRLRAAAVFVALLPLHALVTVRHRLVSFLLTRCTELAFLAAGALLALPLCYGLFRIVLAEAPASYYLAQNIQLFLNPGPLMKVLLAVKPDVGREFMQFFRDSPVLFIGASGVVLAVAALRSVPRTSKALIALLTVVAFALTLLMSRRYFTAQYSIFPQVPLLLALALSLAAVLGRQREPHPADARHWGVPLLLAAAFVIMLTGYLRVRTKYLNYQDDAAVPVSSLTLTFLFDHDVHPPGYLKAMKDHYGDRDHFAEALRLYLADPANRY
jgi:hypothetical protein